MIQALKQGKKASITNELVSDVANTIRDRFHPEKVILFGSVSRGQYRQGSDLDLFVVMRSDLPDCKRASAIRRALPRSIPMDILVYTPEEVAYWNGAVGHIVTEVLKTGRVLYDKSA